MYVEPTVLAGQHSWHPHFSRFEPVRAVQCTVPCAGVNLLLQRYSVVLTSTAQAIRAVEGHLRQSCLGLECRV